MPTLKLTVDCDLELSDAVKFLVRKFGYNNVMDHLKTYHGPKIDQGYRQHLERLRDEFNGSNETGPEDVEQTGQGWAEPLLEDPHTFVDNED